MRGRIKDMTVQRAGKRRKTREKRRTKGKEDGREEYRVWVQNTTINI